MPPLTRKRKRDSECAARNDLLIENMGHFKVLPTEILEMIFYHLDAPSLSSLSSTCKNLRERTMTSWKVICKRLGPDYTPTPLCVLTACETSPYCYDEAVKLCTSDETRWRVICIRHWLYCRWRCIICYRACSQRIDPHRDILLCETCHPLFYKRKSNAKEQFGLSERDISLITSNGYEYLVTDLIFLARTKYGGKEGFEERLQEKREQRIKREAERECTLVERESEVVEALERNGSSYSQISFVDARFMPYVSIPATYRRCSSQTADDAAKWLISLKDRYEARYKALVDQIVLRTSRCRGCQNQRIRPIVPCNHISPKEAERTIAFIKENFLADIQHYTKTGLLNQTQNGPTDCEGWAAGELFERAERKEKLRRALKEFKEEWPPIVQEGVKNPLECSIAEDYIYKAVVVLEYQTGKCRLKQAKEVARVILAAARGWDIRNRELLDAMEARGFFPPFVSLKHESKTLMDDFVDHMVIVRGGSMVACSASEVAAKVAALEGLAPEPLSPTTKRCSRIYNECQSREDYQQLQRDREKSLKGCLGVRNLGDQNDPIWAPAHEFVKCGSASSLFGYRLTTTYSVAAVVRLRLQVAAKSQVIGNILNSNGQQTLVSTSQPPN